MARHNFGQMKVQADADGGGSFAEAEVLPEGTYDVEIKAVKASSSKAGKDQVGVKFRVLSGAYAGKETWVNQTLTPDNPTSVAIFIRVLTSLGVPAAAFADGAETEELAKFIVKGQTGVANLTVSNGDRQFQNLKSFSFSAIAAGAPVATAPVYVAPPVAAPVAPVAPVVAPVAAPIAAPVVAAINPDEPY